MKRTLAILALGLLLTSCSRCPDCGNSCRKIPRIRMKDRNHECYCVPRPEGCPPCDCRPCPQTP